MNSSRRRNYLLLLSFIEGACVMACELLGAKIIIPVFGVSIFVWAAVLAVTLLGLMAGYFAGGWLSRKYDSDNLVYWVLLNAAFFLFLMPFSGQWIIETVVFNDIYIGSVTALMVTIFPPLVFMGMTSPVLIHRLSENVENSGKNAGLIYSVSTAGGIIATFVTGFWLLPSIGIRTSSLIFAVLLGTLPLISLLASRRFVSLAYLAASVVIFSSMLGQGASSSGEIRIRYQSEGILGQLKVIDFDFYSVMQQKMVPSRALLVNNSSQTIIERSNPENNLWAYPYFMDALTSIYPAGSDVLQLGLGGGAITARLQKSNFNMDVVDIDARLQPVAVRYFGMNPDVNVIIDDGRHYTRTTNKQYDIIVSDMYLSEAFPIHTLTFEYFTELKSIIKPGGALFINFYGKTSGKDGRAVRSLYKTLTAAGYQTKMLATMESEAWREIIFVASLEELDISTVKPLRHGVFEITDIQQSLLDVAAMNMSDAIVLTDNHPQLEQMYLGMAMTWRIGDNAEYTHKFIRDGQPVFK